MINFNPEGTFQREDDGTGAFGLLYWLEMNLAASKKKCGICGADGEGDGVLVRGVPEAHCARCRAWLRDSMRVLFFTDIHEELDPIREL